MPLENLLGLGGGDSLAPSVSPRDAQSLALIQAMQQTQQAGLQRTASPIGSIAQALIPLFAAPIAAKQAQQKAMLQDLLIKLQLAKALKGTGDDKKTTAEIAKLNAETDKTTAETAYRKKLLANPTIAKMLEGGGDTADAAGGMKPKVTMGITGPGISYSSDVMSPERLQQQKDIAVAGSGRTLSNQKELATFKAALPAKMTTQDRQTVEAGTTLLSLLDNADGAIGSLPKNMAPSDLASNMRNYQIRSQHPLLVNAGKSILGDIASFSNDPAVDQYASWIGQTQSALASFNVQGQRGGIRLLQYLQDHFPNYADSPGEAQRKAGLLKKDSSVIKQRIQSILDETHQAAKIADDMGGEAAQGWIKKKIRNKATGQEQDIMMNPITGESMIGDNAE